MHSSRTLPTFRDQVDDIIWLRNCLRMGLTDDEAAEHFTKQIYAALTCRTTQLNNAVHIVAHS